MIAAQTMFKGPDVAISTSILIFLQSLAGTVFLSVAQNVFEGRLQSVLRSKLPDVNPADVLGVGAADVGRAMREKYPQQTDGILDAYNEGIRSVFLTSLIFACLAVFGIPFMEWHSVKKAKQAPVEDGQKAAEAGEAEKTA